MKKTIVLPCFDTEDYTSMYSAEAAARVARFLESEGIKGNFMVVGLLAEELVRHKRYDIIETLSAHEINFHTKGHSLHPTICEYTDLEDFRKASELLVREEAEGMGMVRAVFGQDKFYCAVPPGPSWSYVAMIMYTEMGLPVYTDSPFKTKDGRDVYFCGALHLDYSCCFEFDVMKHGRPSDADIDALKDKFAEREKILFYNHPNRFVYCQFWDKVNYDRTNNCEYGHWKEAERLSAEDVELFFDTYKRVIESIKNDERFEFGTISGLAEARAALPQRKVTADMIPAIKAALEKEFMPVKSPVSLSISEVFGACLSFLSGSSEYVPERIYGFLSRPAGITSRTEVSAEAVRSAAARITASGDKDLPFFLPPVVTVGCETLGAADFLFAMLETLCGTEKIILEPREQMNSLDEYPEAKNCYFKDRWIHWSELNDDYLSERLRLQAWTLRY